MADRFPPDGGPDRDHAEALDRRGSLAEEAAANAAMSGRLLRTVRVNFEGLPWIEEYWQQAKAEGRAETDKIVVHQIGFRDEWRDLMDILQELHQQYQRGSLTVEQERQYEALLPLIRETLPIIERVGLALPPLIVLDQTVGPATVSADIDFYLRLVRRTVELLPRIDQRRADPAYRAGFTAEERLDHELSFRDDWSDLMDRLERYLHAPFEAGRMSRAQAEGYRTLLSHIREMQPAIERLGLAPPSDTVLADAASATPHPMKTA